MPHPSTRVALALGSNLGDRRGHLAFAAERLAAHLSDVRLSPVYDTEPVDVPGEQPSFLNAAALGTFAGSADECLAVCLAIEAERGRHRPFRGAPRTLDLDLILFGDQVIDRPGLHVPHPRFRDRAFVLRPLCDLDPGLRDPVTGLTVAALLQRLGPDRLGAGNDMRHGKH